MQPKVSIVVPVYNVEKYLCECLDSLVAQTYKNTEIIIVDDGSKDGSPTICDKYEKEYENIKVIHKQNEGLGLARNTGLEHVTGDYVSFMDSDDYADTNMVANLMKALIDSNADTVIGGFKKIDDNKNILFTEKYENQIFENEDVYQKFFLHVLGSIPKKHDSFRMSVWNAIYSVKVIKENNIIFPSERVMISEDLIFDEDYYRVAEKVMIIDDTSYNYRCNVESLSVKYRENKFSLINDLYNEMNKRIQNKFVHQHEADTRLKTMYLIQTKACISQEKSKKSGKTFKGTLNGIKSICYNPLTIDVSDSYPLNELDFKQKVFVFLLKHKAYRILAIISQIGVI